MLSSQATTTTTTITRHFVSTNSGKNSLIYSVFDKLKCCDSSSTSDILILDGGTGEELFRRGVPDDRKIWSAKAVVEEQYHGVLQQVHRDYIRAGSKAITTNSYGIVPGVFGFKSTSDDTLRKYVSTAGRLAREVVDSEQHQHEHDQQVIVMGSLGPLLESYRPDRLLTHEHGLQTYHLIAESLSPFVDCFIAETMSCFEEVSQAVEGISKLNRDMKRPMLASYTLGSDGRLRSGESASSAICCLIEFAKRHDVELLGILFNCCEPESITKALDDIVLRDESTTASSTTTKINYRNNRVNALLESEGILLGAYANRLTPISSDWSMETSTTPQPFRHDLATPDIYFHKFVRSWVHDYGLKMIGGCCGISPEHISYIASHISDPCINTSLSIDNK